VTLTWAAPAILGDSVQSYQLCMDDSVVYEGPSTTCTVPIEIDWILDRILLNFTVSASNAIGTSSASQPLKWRCAPSSSSVEESDEKEVELRLSKKRSNSMGGNIKRPALTEPQPQEEVMEEDNDNEVTSTATVADALHPSSTPESITKKRVFAPEVSEPAPVNVSVEQQPTQCSLASSIPETSLSQMPPNRTKVIRPPMASQNTLPPLSQTLPSQDLSGFDLSQAVNHAECEPDPLKRKRSDMTPSSPLKDSQPPIKMRRTDNGTPIHTPIDLTKENKEDVVNKERTMPVAPGTTAGKRLLVAKKPKPLAQPQPACRSIAAYFKK